MPVKPRLLSGFLRNIVRLGLAVLLGVVSGTSAFATDLVGTLPGSLTVDNKGAANYSIPLMIPPGRGEMQPNLALSYHSQTGNGPLGVGWSLSTGFPQAITRGRNILARDGVVRGVNFDADDRFYLDGKRLVVVDGTTNGALNSKYRTEVDSFQEIVATGSTTYIETFTATDKTGTKYIYGKVTGADDGFQKGGGETGDNAFAYALKRVEDAAGNYVSFTYVNRGDGEYVLSQIDYTGNGTTVSPQASVEFSYGTSADAPVGFLAGRHFKQGARLDNITTKIKVSSTPQIAARYDFDYDFTSSVKRSRLTSVTPFLADTESPYTLKEGSPTSILWGSNPSQLAVPGSEFSPQEGDLDFTEARLSGDFNGDGRSDVLFYSVEEAHYTVLYRDWTMSVSSYTAGSGWTTQTSTLADLRLGIRLVTTGDFNGDGKTDLVFMQVGLGNQGGGWYLSLATDEGFSALQLVVANTNITAENKCVLESALVVDLDGDGLDELMFQVDIQIAIPSSTWLVGAFESGVYDAGIFGVDLGNDSAVVRPHQPTRLLRPKWVAGVLTFTETALTVPRILHEEDFSPISYRRIDANGDGRSDLLVSVFQIDVFGDNVTEGWFSQILLNGGSDSFEIKETQFSAGTAMYSSGANAPGHLDLIGDVNGDGLDDVVTLNINTTTAGWSVVTSKGNGDFDSEAFTGIPTQVSIDSTDVFTFQRRSGTVSTGPIPGSEGGGEQGIYGITGRGGYEITGASLMDYNCDGRKDFVWYSQAKGWRCFLSTGTGFDVTTALPIVDAGSDGLNYFVSALYEDFDNPYSPDYDFRFEPVVMDIDGSGRESLVLLSPQNAGSPRNLSARVAYNASAFSHRISKVTDGLGAKTEIAYAPISLESIYTSGVDVSYPIRESRRQVVVSDIYRDHGGNFDANERQHFSYQYSGNRLDLSGRGGLGFHSFVTLDHQTNLFKYQFLTQSFPMTGLTAREETYRHLGEGKFRAISSHDNTVVFDEVVKSPTVATPWGTVFPFISQAVEYRWENSDTEHFTLSGSGPSSRPELAFREKRPTGHHIKITATSWFDKQNVAGEPQTTIPEVFAPSDTNVTVEGSVTTITNVVTGIASYADFENLTFDRNITYGNLTQLKTDYGDSYTETVKTTYHDADGPLTGLVNTVDTTVTTPVSAYASENAPTKSYTYWTNGATPTPLVESEATSTGDTELDFTLAYDRDDLGRVEYTEISGYNNEGHARHIGTYKLSQATAFDAQFDLPTTTKNAEPYEHPTTIVYHPVLGMPSNVTDVNGVEIQTDYDALGRVKKVRNDSTGITTDTDYAWTASGATDWKKTQTVDVPSGVSGLTLSSVYAVRTKTTAQPAVVAYFDRLGRTIRTVKDGFGALTATTDTVYNALGQVVAVSNPYVSSATHWTKNVYDELGRVEESIAGNLTKTSSEYIGRATKVTVVAKDSNGTTDLPAQTNTTLVDAKGRTIKVWNADNVPTFTGMKGETETNASIQFELDGFGRMRATKLLGQTVAIEATYDELGRQKTLKDPDKGEWTYTNNALGHVVTQSDIEEVVVVGETPKGTVTTSKFDRLGRLFFREAVEVGTGVSVETANWYYYETAADSDWNLVALGEKGWIGALQRTTHVLTGAPGYIDPGSTRYFYYDDKGRPQIALSDIDNKWFYTHTSYDASNRVDTVRHYWRPSPHESPDSYPGLWDNFGYTYAYDSESYVLTVKDTLNRTWWAADTSDGYDYLDRPVKVQKGSAHWTQRAYRDSDGVLESINTGPAVTTDSIQNLSFGFDGLGNLRSRTGKGGTETLGYDVLNRLTSSKQGAISYEANGNIKRKSNVGGTAAPADFGYTSTRPHAVTSAFGYTMEYDGNGNLLTRTHPTDDETWSLKWTGFDKPRWMAKTVGTTPAITIGSEFLYDANRSRVVHLEFDEVTGSGVSAVPSHYTRKKIYAAGAAMEVDYTNSVASPATPVWKQTKIRLYIPAPDGTAGAVELPPSDVGGVRRDLVYHHDHLGSIESITSFGNFAADTYATDSSGKGGMFSEDAWGARRNPTTWSGVPTSTDDGGPDSLTPRGYTGHEMLDGLGLVHANGRIYDPLLGRFVSADVLVQFPGNMQSYNRYSYVANNPLSFTDKSGYTIDDPHDNSWLRKSKAYTASGNHWKAMGYGMGAMPKAIADSAVFIFRKALPEGIAEAKQNLAQRNASGKIGGYETALGRLSLASLEVGSGIPSLAANVDRIPKIVAGLPGKIADDVKAVVKNPTVSNFANVAEDAAIVYGGFKLAQGFSGGMKNTVAAAEASTTAAAEAVPAKLYHYTGEANVAAILENGLRPGASGKVFTTTVGDLTPMQAQIELALSPNRGLPGAVFEVDTTALQQHGISPSAGPMRVLPTTNAAGGGVEVTFDSQIPPSALKLLEKP